ncbi:single-stranded DNA-binding protein [Carnobacteriaceae bacterium zg-ZUI240]|nr:single-stranded DNA-binding protein [Carnobacteriaceae bacterium zg-ZUI240]
MNIVSLTGRLTADPELKYTQSGISVVRFLLAVNRRFAKDGQISADFINCQIWNKPAETLAYYTRKGSLIGVVGRIQTGSYEKDGHRVYTTDVIVESFDFLESKQNSAQNAGQESKAKFDIEDYDLPF